MRFLIPAVLAVAAINVSLAAQDVKMPANLDKLAAKASEVVDVTLDGPLLQLAGRFLSDKDPDEANVKKLIGGLKGVYVKSFEFESANQYSDSDVADLRTQLHSPGWARIVGARSKKNGENSEVYLKTESGQITGLAVIVTEPKQLTVVNIVGYIRPEDLRDLGGHLGIPKIYPDGMKKGEKKEDEK